MSKKIWTGAKEFFPGIGKIEFKPDSESPLAFRIFDPERVVRGKRMIDHFRFAIAYWHSFCGDGKDIFGPGTVVFPWEEMGDPITAALFKQDVAFEFISKLLGADGRYCFHDRDFAPEGDTPSKSADNLKCLVDAALEKQEATGIQLLWGTANVFSHPRYMNGAATNPDFHVLPHVAAQVKAAIDATIALGGENYVFWGGREGYFSILNTCTKREKEHLATFLKKARDYGRHAGFEGTFLIEPKPMEPTKHQYDYDSEVVIAFLEKYGLVDDFKLNIENNHATLAGHTYDHDVWMAYNSEMFGSLDINQGDPFNGWDTDEFLVNLYDATRLMLALLENDGIGTGGMNFDAKRRRSSVDWEDLFIAHISSIDTMAAALLIADDLLENSCIASMRDNRYSSFDEGEGAQFESGEMDFVTLANLAEEWGEPESISAHQELFEKILNEGIMRFSPEISFSKYPE